MSTVNPEAGLSQQYLNEYSGNSLVAVAITFTVLEIIFVTLRYVSRHLVNTSLGLDDLLVLPGLIFCISLNASGLAMVIYAGAGYHVERVEVDDPAKLVVWAKFLISIPVLYAVAVTLPKLAILSMYLRIFTEKRYRYTAYALAAILVITAIIEIFIGIFECVPVAFFWDKTIPGGKCDINTNAYYRFASIPNILTDIAMLILPMPVIWKLQTTTNVKIGLTLTFLTGSIGLLFSILRFVNFFTVNATEDGTWATVDLVIWSIVEPGMYLIASCLPACRPLFVKTIRGLGFKGTIYGSGGHSSGGRGGTRSSRPAGPGVELSTRGGGTIGGTATGPMRSALDRSNFKRLSSTHNHPYAGDERGLVEAYKSEHQTDISAVEKGEFAVRDPSRSSGSTASEGVGVNVPRPVYEGNANQVHVQREYRVFA